MVTRDIPVIVVAAQFRRFMNDRVHTEQFGDLTCLPKEVRDTAITMACLQLFSVNINDTARWN